MNASPFLGLGNLFERFVRMFARVAALFNCKLDKERPLHFERLEKTEIDALKTLQHQLLSLPIQSLPRPNGRFTLDMDAYDEQVGCVLLQK